MDTGFDASPSNSKRDIPVHERFRKACGRYLKNHNSDRYYRYYVSAVDESAMTLLLAFMERQDVPRGAKSALIGKLRYETTSFTEIMNDAAQYYDEAIALRARYLREQTYSGMMTIVCGLSSYGTHLTAADKSNLLGITYSALTLSSPYRDDNGGILIYESGARGGTYESGPRRRILLRDDIVALALSNKENAEDIQALIASGITDTMRIERVLKEGVPRAFASGSL